MTTRGHRRRLLILAVAVVASIGGCGQSSTEADGSVTTSSTNAPEETNATSTTTSVRPSTTGASASSTDPEPAGSSSSGGGSATLTIAGEELTFDFFTCYTGEAAIEATGDGDSTFAAFGQVETGGATATVAVSATDLAVGPNFSIFYSPTSELTNGWQRVGADAVSVDGDRVTSEGDFERIVDGQRTGDTDDGTFDGTCGSG